MLQPLQWASLILNDARRAMTDELQQQPTRTYAITFPARARLMVGGAFLLGMAVFAISWVSGRDKVFFQADGQASPSEDIVLAPLPAPLAAGGASQMPAPLPSTEQVRPHVVETPVPPPTPVDETLPVDTAAPVASAPAATPVASPTDAPPQRIAGQSPAPQYPASALRKGERGVVVLNVQIDAQGRPSRVRIAERSGSRALDRAAIDAVQRWRFTPAQAAGQAVPGEVQIPIEFSP